MNMQAVGKIEIQINDEIAEVKWTAPLKRIDISFSHEFGTHADYAYESTLELSYEVEIDLKSLDLSSLRADEAWRIEHIARAEATAAYLKGEYKEKEVL